METYWGVEV